MAEPALAYLLSSGFDKRLSVEDSVKIIVFPVTNGATSRTLAYRLIPTKDLQINTGEVLARTILFSKLLEPLRLYALLLFSEWERSTAR